MSEFHFLESEVVVYSHPILTRAARAGNRSAPDRSLSKRRVALHSRAPITEKYRSADTSGLTQKVDQPKVTYPIPLD